MPGRTVTNWSTFASTFLGGVKFADLLLRARAGNYKQSNVINANAKSSANPPEEKVRPKLSVDVGVNFGGTVNTASDVVTTKDDDLSLTTLHDAAKVNNPKAIARLLKAGADVNEREKPGVGIGFETPPLHYAVIHHSMECIAALIEAGADIGMTDNETKSTFLHYAALKNFPEAITSLLKAGANIEAKNRVGKTPLHYAATTNASESMAVLIKASANINAKDEYGDTPLHIAAEGQVLGDESSEGIAVLLKAGADIEAENKNYKIPLQIAIEKKQTESIKLLRNARNERKAKAKGDVNLNAKPVKEGFDISSRGKKPLPSSVTAGADILNMFKSGVSAEEAIGTLLKQSSRSTSFNPDADYGTPLHFAILYGADDIIDVLLHAGVNVNAETKKGLTPSRH